MKVTQVPIDSIKPYDMNPRKNESGVAAVAISIAAFGFRQPIVVDKNGVIIVGHTRWKAAKQLGLDTVPVHVADLTPEQARAYRIADNQTAALSQWDMEKLALEVRAVQHDGLATKIGFSDAELEALLNGDRNTGLTDEDDVPAPPEAPVAKPGDIWLLGQHRVMCGDSSVDADVDALLDGAEIHMVNTDPPYNVSVEPRSNNAMGAGLSSFPRTKSKTARGGKTSAKLRAKDRPITNDALSDAEYARVLKCWFGNIARALIPGGAFYIWGGYANCGAYPPALKECGLYFAQAIIWIKEHPVMNRKDFMGNHEWCFYGWKEGAAHKFYGPHNITDTWSVKKVMQRDMEHLTEKPVELARRALSYSSLAGQNVLDLFGGSGSTLIAAEELDRRCYIMELDPVYVDVIVNRWEAFTGRKAERICSTR